MSENDDKLHALLHQWRDIKPSATFEVDVRRRIRLAAPAPTHRFPWLNWLTRPAWATVAALVIGLAIGSWNGIHAVSASESSPLKFATAGTLAGSYSNLRDTR